MANEEMDRETKIEFLRDSANFLRSNKMGAESVNMGPHQYYYFEGTYEDGTPIAGAKQWNIAEEARTSGGTENMASAERRLAQVAGNDIRNRALLPNGMQMVEYGPGTVDALKNQTMHILKSFHGAKIIIVDKSIKFLNDIYTDQSLLGLDIIKIVSNFFKGNEKYCDEAQALLCMFGTISNLHAAVSDELPEDALAESLVDIANGINEGWLLLSFDGDQNGEKIKAYYEQHPRFQLNFFHLMKSIGELVDENFDPYAFDYKAEWHASSGQLAHMAVLNRDITFTLKGQDGEADEIIQYKMGDRLHIKNSFKFTPEFFERCCAKAGLDVVKQWADDPNQPNASPVKFYLLKKLMPHLPYQEPRYTRQENPVLSIDQGA